MNPWPDERVVVVTDDPTAVEAAVLQLENWGASPAVMFERGRALRALHVREPDLVVLDLGRSPEATHSLLISLEEVQKVLPGAVHPATLVVLAEGPTAQRIGRDAWAPLLVTPHDDPDRMRAALTAAHQATIPSPLPQVAGAASPAFVPPTIAAPAGAGRAASIVPVAAALLIAGVSVWFAFQQAASTTLSVTDPTKSPLSTAGIATPPASLAAAALPASPESPANSPDPTPTAAAAAAAAVAPTSIPAQVAASTIQAPAATTTTAARTALSLATTGTQSDASPAATLIPSNAMIASSDPARALPAPTTAGFPITGSR